MNNPVVSVIIPVYNVEAYLGRCVDSVMAQSLRNIEIILIDDGSTDGCPAICDEYAHRDSRVKVIHQENGGSSSARNAGLNIAAGNYIAFVDSDDWIEPCMYEKLLDTAKKSDADIVTCNFTAHYPDSVKANIMDMHDDVVSFSNLDYFRLTETFGKQSSIFVWNSIYRHNLIKQTKITFLPIQLILSEDQLFNLCFYSAVRCAAYINESYYNYFVRKGSLSHKESMVGILNARINLVIKLKDYIDVNHFNKQKSSFYIALMWKYFVDGCATIHNKQRMLHEIELIQTNRKFFKRCLISLLLGKAGRYHIKRSNLSFKASLYFRYMLMLMILDRLDKPIDTFLISCND